jgi:uncharacterized protein (TIGR02217 family)
MALPVFPTLPGLMFPMKRKSVWSTVKQDALSGKRTRYPLWTYPLYQWEISFDFLRTAAAFLEWQTLEGFIKSVQGAAQLFAYLDPNDSVATAQGFGAGDGVTTSFQLVRALGGFAEPVFLPVLSGGLVTQITVAGTPTTAYTVSPYGVVTFTSAPANGAALAWTGTFYFGCRFDDDATDFSNFMSGLFELKSPLKFSSEKLP